MHSTNPLSSLPVYNIKQYKTFCLVFLNFLAKKKDFFTQNLNKKIVISLRYTIKMHQKLKKNNKIIPINGFTILFNQYFPNH